MRSQNTNICHNPRFNLWPFGTSGFTATGKTGAARWKMERTNGSDLVTVSRGVNANATIYDKWLRGAANMTIAVTGLATNSTLRIRQFLEGYQDFGQNIIAMTVIASGPAGGRFMFGAGDNYSEIMTEGDDANGNPILVTRTEFFPFDDPQFEYLRVTPFEGPSQTGTYRLHHVQAEVVEDPTQLRSLELRPEWVEWGIIARYVTPIKAGMMGVALSTNDYLHVPVVSPPGGWRIPPTLATEGRAANLIAYRLSTSLLHTSASPNMSIFSTPAADRLGCNVQIGPFASPALTSGAQYILGGNTDQVVCYLNADYF